MIVRSRPPGPRTGFLIRLHRSQGENLQTILGPQEATQQKLVEIFPEPAARKNIILFF